ncbi:MAG: hypothetical protein ACTHK8_02190 [Ginsengibacter sp.]|nr:hypothetical protein [Hanamia sp.]
MQPVKKIACKVSILLLEIILLVITTAGDLILPGKKRKGNILSSLFDFFVGSIEILNRFEIGLFQVAKIFRQKHVKQAIVIASAFLFLLTTFEWAPVVDQGLSYTGFKTEVPVADTPIAKNSERSKATNTSYFFPAHITVSAYPDCLSFFKISHSPKPVKRFLFIRSILI